MLYWPPLELLIQEKLGKKHSTKSKSASVIPEFSKFFLEAVQEVNQEKMQIVETFNDWYVFFYGERPPTYTFSGYLLNLHNYNWWNEFAYYYQNFWRGTKAVEKKVQVFLTYNYQQIQGYVLNMSSNLNAMTDKVAPFSITVLVTKRLIFSGTKDDNILRDSLLPRTDTGFINTSHNVKESVKALTRDFLQKKLPAVQHESEDSAKKIDMKNIPKGDFPSTKPQNPMDIGGLGASQAASLKKGLNFSTTFPKMFVA